MMLMCRRSIGKFPVGLLALFPFPCCRWRACHLPPPFMARLVSCSKCGRIHPAGECPRGAEKRGGGYGHKKDTKANDFRSSWSWTQKSKAIRERDHYLCQACLHNLDGTGIRYTRTRLEVHHIVALESDFDKRLDEDNLITLCREHHEQAEAHKLDTSQLLLIAKSNSEEA